MKKKYSANQLGSAALVAAIISGVATSSSMSFARNSDDMSMPPMQIDQGKRESHELKIENKDGNIFPIMNFMLKQREQRAPSMESNMSADATTTDTQSEHKAAEDLPKPPRSTKPPCEQSQDREQEMNMQEQNTNPASLSETRTTKKPVMIKVNAQEKVLAARIAMTQKAITMAQARLAKATDDAAKAKITTMIAALQTTLATLQTKLAAMSSTSSVTSSDSTSSTVDTSSSAAQ